MTGFRLLLVICFIAFSAGMSWAERLTVKTTIANIRSGPGTQYDVLWQAERYYPIQVLRTSGPWYYFSDFEGDTGWIHRSLLARIPSVITHKDKANVRSGPGAKYKIRMQIGKGIPFRVLGRKDNWVHVKHGDGDEGWIYSSLLW